MDQAITAKPLDNGNFLIGDQTVTKEQLETAIQKVGAKGLFNVNGKIVSQEKAFDALTKSTAAGPTINALTIPAPNLENKSMVDVVLLLQKMQMDSAVTMKDISVTKINDDREVKKAKHEEKLEKINNRIEGIEDSAGKAKKAGTWSKVGQAVAIATGAMALLAGAALTIGSLGLAGGVGVMLAMAGVALITTTSMEIHSGNCPYVDMCKAVGMPDEAAKWTGMVLKMLLTITCGAGAGAYTAGATAGVGAAATATGTAVQAGATVATQAATVAAAVAAAKAKLVIFAIKVTANSLNALVTLFNATVSLVSTTGSSTNSVLAAKAQKGADMDQADTKEIERWMKTIQARIQDETDMIGELIEQINEGFDRVTGIMSSVFATSDNIAGSIRRSA